MDNMQFDILDTNIEDNIIEYEKKLYHAYVEYMPDEWYIKEYEMIDGNRLRSPFSYNDQRIYILKKENKIIGGAALNFNTNNMQLEQVGFKLMSKKNTCEGLSIFISEIEKKDTLIHSLYFFDNVVEDLKKRKIKSWYLTCAKKLLSFFKFLDFEAIDSLMIDNEIEYLMKYSTFN